MKMHDDEVDIDVDLVRHLVGGQFPELADLPVLQGDSAGTVNAIYRLGEHLCVRLPRASQWAESLNREAHWLPRLAAHLSLTVPEPVAQGHPTPTYPFAWAVYRWIEGAPYSGDLVDDERQAAESLGRFVRELRRIDPAGAPQGGRAALRELDPVTRSAIGATRGVGDPGAVNAAWDRALQAPLWDGRATWIHADLLRPNLLVNRGRLCAVIDFGGAGVGDPAADVIAAWSVFGAAGRQTYRRVLDVDDGTWARARGFALHQAVLIIPYYRDSNPGFVAQAERTVKEILAEA